MAANEKIRGNAATVYRQNDALAHLSADISFKDRVAEEAPIHIDVTAGNTIGGIGNPAITNASAVEADDRALPSRKSSCV